jgi:hypothetical protein
VSANFSDVVKARVARPRAKARALEAKAKARTLKAKAKDVIFCPRGSSRPRPVLEDYITDISHSQKQSQ